MNPITLNTGEQLDPQAVRLMKAIRKKESGGNYNAVGDAGTSTGAFQFQAPTWKRYAKEVLGDENAVQDKANQNKVAYTKVKKWKDSGWSPEQVAAAWNAGEGRAMDGSWANHRGETVINGQTIKYDTPKYVQDVISIAKQLKQEEEGSNPHSNGGYITQPSFTPKPEVQPQEAQVEQPETLGSQLKERLSKAGTALTESAQGKINPFRGLLRTVGEGAGALGDITGSALNTASFGLLNKAEKAIGAGVGKLADTGVGKSALEAVSKFQESNPELSKDIGAVGNIASAIPIFKGVGMAGRAAKAGIEKTFSGATKNAIKNEIKSAANRTVSGRKALDKLGEDGLEVLAKKEIAPVIDGATGKYTAESIKSSSDKLDDMISQIEDNELQPLLQKGSNELISQRVPLENYKKLAMQEAEDNFKDPSTIEAYFERIKKRLGDYPTIGQLNEAKRTVARNIKEAGFNSPTYSTDKAVRDALQQSVEDGAKALNLGDVQAINQKMASLIKAQKLLEAIKEKNVKQGLIRKIATNAGATTKKAAKKGISYAGKAALIGLGGAGAIEGFNAIRGR